MNTFKKNPSSDTRRYDQIDRFKEMKATDIAEAIFSCCPDTAVGGKRVQREDILGTMRDEGETILLWYVCVCVCVCVLYCPFG